MLDGKVAIVTGAGHGIGRGHAMELARQGAQVVVNDLGGSVGGEGTSRDADLTVEIIESRGGVAVANYEDVADHEGAGRLVAQAVDDVGPARHPGQQRRHRPRRRHLEHERRRLRRRHAGPRARARGARATGPPSTGGPGPRRARRFTGRIINTTSGAGLVGNFGQTNYATAKAAIAGLTQTLSLELYRLGVTVNAVGPAGATRITATMPGAPAVIEPDDLGEDDYDPMDPATARRRSWRGWPPTRPST